MNIKLRLPFKIIQNNKIEEVDKIAKDAKETIKNKLEDFEKKTSAIRRDIDFWKREMKKRNPNKKCTKCGQEVELWPFNSKEGYYIKGNRVTHQKCVKGE